MDTIILAVIAAVVAVFIAVMIPLFLEVRRTVAALRQTTEQKLNPALEELQETLKSVRQITDNVNVITDDVKRFSGSTAPRPFGCSRRVKALITSWI